VMIVYALAMGQNVMVLFLATLIPGIIMGILFSIINVIICRKFNTVPLIVGSYGNQVKLIGKAGYNASLGLVMPVLLFGGIYGGLFTPTEGAAVSTLYVVLICFFAYRTINIKTFRKILVNTGGIAAAILLAIVFVSLFSKILVMHDIPNQVARAIISLSDNKVIILLLVNILLVGVGMLMDDISGALVTLPILMPLMNLLGVPMTQLAAILACNLGCGLMTPPVAPNLYVGARISGLSIADFMGYTLYFLLFGGVPTVLLVTYVPSCSLWLPTLVFGAGAVR
jgi:C4-dicarboxylate transporter, DctM subunit